RSTAAIVPPSKTSCTNGAPFHSPTARGPDQIPGGHAAHGPDRPPTATPFDSLDRARRPTGPGAAHGRLTARCPGIRQSVEIYSGKPNSTKRRGLLNCGNTG